ncbi:Nitrogenase FeMo-cofactor carrier protein NifX [hydrothermal vent metagenome]|uniref:Nitrogenase FeMo-cofactor carrier protein NifX n=1 Tax=hydrothermal vent metagenome TaxID=652676 RepID=A0A3B1BKN8_9ZZZZ
MPVKRRLSIVDSVSRLEGNRTSTETELKVAFASTDMETVNQHFGSASSFSIYVLNQNTFRLFEVVQFGEMEQDGNEDKLLAKLDALEECIAVYSQAIGASAIAQLKARDMQPVKVTSGSLIVDIIESLQSELRTGAGVWLARAIKKQKKADPERFNDMEAEGWEE